MAASVALMVISAATPFPAELVALANGVIYGPGWGAAITWGGGMLGALLTFGIFRWFGRPLTRSLRHRCLRQWVGKWTDVESGMTLLIARLIPLIPFCLLNYAAGLTGMGWRTFVWATGLGILPFTVLMAVAGDWMGTLQWQIGFVVLGAVVALWLVLHRRSGGFSKGRLENGPGKIKYQGEN
ncbi:MAG: VTT domain-containing protein [Alphaproteobacteria bacterium]|nr:VTT domain-containing protein [Alphaproteobacteria bacterium]